MRQWFYLSPEGESSGPVPEDLLRNICRNAPQTLVVEEGKTEWRPAQIALALGDSPKTTSTLVSPPSRGNHANARPTVLGVPVAKMPPPVPCPDKARPAASRAPVASPSSQNASQRPVFFTPVAPRPIDAAHNKVVDVTLRGGIIGLFHNPLDSLNGVIGMENKQGWEVVQVVPSGGRGLFAYIIQALLLVVTLFFYTKVDGWYVVLRKKD
jgi:hypothetical protein